MAFHPIYKHPLPEGHRFPMEKYDLFPKQLLHEGFYTVLDDIFEPNLPSENLILAVHNEVYFNELKSGTLDKRAARKDRFSSFRRISSKRTYNCR